MDPKLIMQALDALIAGDAAACADILKSIVAATAGAEEAPAEEAPPEALAEGADPPVPEEPAQMRVNEDAALTAALRRITGRNTNAEILAELNTMRATVASLATERDAAMLIERRKLVGDLVKLGVEVPATAWEGDPEALTPCKRLASEPIDDLRARVAVLTAARPASNQARMPPGSDGLKALTAVEREFAAEITDDTKRAAFVALRVSRRAS